MNITNFMKDLNLKWFGLFLLLFGVIIVQNNCSSKAKASANNQVMAKDVILNTAGNDLTSTNLQSALDNELAVNLSTLLPGTTWTITNITSDPTYSGITGIVSFTNDTFTLVSGALAAFGIAFNSHCYVPANKISYQLITDKIIYESWVSSQGYAQDGTAFVVAHSKDMLTLLGTGGCGAAGAWRISVLRLSNNKCTVDADCPSGSVCQNGSCAPSSIIPDPPTGLTATTPGSGIVVLSWNASSGAASYNVYESTTSSVPFSSPVVVGRGIIGTSMTVTGYTTTATTYYFVVTAVNSAGESGYSNEASATPY